MEKDYFSYFSFNAKLEFEKKYYHLKITLLYNTKISRKEFEILSDDFPGTSKLLVYQILPDKSGYEWIDINTQDNSALVQELGGMILKQNI